MSEDVAAQIQRTSAKAVPRLLRRLRADRRCGERQPFWPKRPLISRDYCHRWRTLEAAHGWLFATSSAWAFRKRWESDGKIGSLTARLVPWLVAVAAPPAPAADWLACLIRPLTSKAARLRFEHTWSLKQAETSIGHAHSSNQANRRPTARRVTCVCKRARDCDRMNSSSYCLNRFGPFSTNCKM